MFHLFCDDIKEVLPLPPFGKIEGKIIFMWTLIRSASSLYRDSELLKVLGRSSLRAHCLG
jgi:hypothetical protein